ncbi:MAG: transporter substrate-binding domain-containing protein [Desulfobacula sp.]|nr:transporter substrate-binding domain-containing protein [Desulfobacula sp.]
MIKIFFRHKRMLSLLVRFSLAIFFFSQMVSLSFSAQQQTSLQTVTISAIVNEQTHAIAKQVLKKAYKKIGYDAGFNDLPGKRALEWANKGLTDGDVARIKGTQKKFSNLVRVKIPVIHFKGVVFSKTIDKPIKEWKDLNGLRIGVVRGIRYSTLGTKGMNPFFANDMTHLFSILDKDRIEVAVAVLDAGKIEIEHHFKNSGIHVIGNPLFSAPLYHFINIKNKSLLKKLEKILTQMTASGEIVRIQRQALEKLMNN